MDWVETEISEFQKRLEHAINGHVAVIALDTTTEWQPIIYNVADFDLYIDANPNRPLSLYAWAEPIFEPQPVLPITEPMPPTVKYTVVHHTPLRFRFRMYPPLEADFWVKLGEQAIDAYGKHTKKWTYKEAVNA